VSVFNLTYATTQAVVGTLRAALTADPLFQPDRTKLSRSADTIVMDAWGYQIRDFPVLVVTGVPGRRLLQHESRGVLGALHVRLVE